MIAAQYAGSANLRPQDGLCLAHGIDCIHVKGARSCPALFTDVHAISAMCCSMQNGSGMAPGGTDPSVVRFMKLPDTSACACEHLVV